MTILCFNYSPSCNSHNFNQECIFFCVSIYAWYFRERIDETDTEEKKSLVFFAHKKYSRSFIKLRSESFRISSKKILICVPKVNKGLTCLERYGVCIISNLAKLSL